MVKENHDKFRLNVRETYAKAATTEGESCCSPTGTSNSCCGSPQPETAKDISMALGYTQEDTENVPQGANLGLGCGNPIAIASLKEGEVVVDLGSGAGFDAFLAAREVGEKGQVVGIDMTHEMLSKARENVRQIGAKNVEFRLGEIEYLPLPNDFADIIISNCVINLSPHKQAVFNDAFRVLKKGGRLSISDVVATDDIPENLKNDKGLIAGCMGGATLVKDLEDMMKKAGFKNIKIDVNEESREIIKGWAPETGVEMYVASAIITAYK